MTEFQFFMIVALFILAIISILFGIGVTMSILDEIRGSKDDSD